MNLVIDTSAILAVLLEEPQKAKLVHATRGMRLLAPASVHWEVGNALTAAFKRGRLELAQARQALSAYAGIAIRYVETDLESTLELCHRNQLYAYDGYVLKCAMSHRSPLLTLDRRLREVARRERLDVMEIAG